MTKEMICEYLGTINFHEDISYDNQGKITEAIEKIKARFNISSLVVSIDSSWLELTLVRVETDEEEEQSRLEKLKAAQYKQYLELKKQFEGT